MAKSSTSEVSPQAQPRHEDETIRQWFPRWLKWHKLANPHNAWPAYEGNDGVKSTNYEAWTKAFERIGMTQALARDITHQIQAQPKPKDGLYPEHHLPRIMEIATAIRAERRIRNETQGAATRAAEKARFEQHQAEERRYWQSLTQAQRDGITRRITAENPALTKWPTMIEALAITWAKDHAIQPDREG